MTDLKLPLRVDDDGEHVWIIDAEGKPVAAEDLCSAVNAQGRASGEAIGYITELSAKDMRERSRGDDPEGGWFVVRYEPDKLFAVALYDAPIAATNEGVTIPARLFDQVYMRLRVADGNDPLGIELGKIRREQDDVKLAARSAPVADKGKEAA